MSGAQFTGGTSGAARPTAGRSRTGTAAPIRRSPDARRSGQAGWTTPARQATPARTTSSGSSGLSLRTRLLLLQIAVTAVFLLIMGIVSTALFAQHLRSQFHATILAESTRSPADIAQRPAPGVAAVEVHVQPVRGASPLTRPVTPARPVSWPPRSGRWARIQVIERGKSDHWFPVPDRRH